MTETLVAAKTTLEAAHSSVGGAFDAHQPPAPELIEDCVHCGFCLPTCPTYALWGEEMDSPRGRIYLMKLGLEGSAAMTDTFVDHFDKCLGCMACVTACPSGVKYDQLIESTRAQIERRHRRSFSEKLFRYFIFQLFPYPKRLRAAAVVLWLYQRSGMRRVLRGAQVLKLLPAPWQAMESVLPSISLSATRIKISARWPAHGEARRRVGLLLGCVQQVFFGGVNQATARVLQAEGCVVIVPRVQGCCGALMVHAGREEGARAFARKIIDEFEQADVEIVAINAAGCGSTLKEYGRLLQHDPAYAERARAFSSKCRDISEVLAELEPRAARHPLRMRVAYHDACHLQHAQGVRSQPREVLRTIPGLEIVEIPEAALCCGSAGIYNLVEPEAARELGERKVQNILHTNAEAIVSSNPGCLLQITSCLSQQNRALPSFHMIELLDASIRGLRKDEG